MVGPSIISQDPPPPYTLQPDPSLPPPYEAVVNGGFEELQISDGRYDTRLQLQKLRVIEELVGFAYR